MQQTWQETLREMLSFIPYGWAFHEICCKRRLGCRSDPGHSSKYDDGLFGWASVAVDRSGVQLVDHQEDTVTPEELELAAYDHVLNFRSAGERHDPGLRGKGRLIESVAFTREKLRAMGLPEGSVPLGWWVGYKIDDTETWTRIKAGEYRMFSVEGEGVREVAKSFEQIYAEACRAVADDGIIDVPEARTFEEIWLEKYNPYHDRLGRFASASGRGGGGAQAPAGGNFTKEELTRYLMGSPKEDVGATQKHIDSKEYQQAAKAALAKGERPKSCFTVSMKSLRAQLQNKPKKGEFEIYERWGNETRAIVLFKTPVGRVYYFSGNGIKYKTTRKVAVSCSKSKGYHMYPIEEDD